MSKLRHLVIENFHCAVTHAPAMITIGPAEEGETNYDAKIPRIMKSDMSKPVRSHRDGKDDMSIVAYTGQNDTDPSPMPPADLAQEVLDCQEACSSLHKTLTLNFSMLKQQKKVPQSIMVLWHKNENEIDLCKYGHNLLDNVRFWNTAYCL